MSVTDTRSATADDGTRQAYRLDGPAGAPYLVFVNSLGASLRMWDAQAAALAPRMRVLRYDTRGHGQSGAPPGPYTLDRLGRDLLGLLDQLGIERAHICGLSLGGLTGQWLAIHHPERVDRLVLASTAARIGSVDSWEARIVAVRAGGMAAIRDAVLARFFGAEFRARRPEVVEQFGATLGAIDPGGYCGACAALRDADLGQLVGQIQAPTLLIAGTLDEATPPAQLAALQQAIPNAQLALLPAAHLSNVEQPGAFDDLLLRFLAAA